MKRALPIHAATVVIWAFAALAVALLSGCAHDQWSCPPPSFQN